MKTVFRKVRVGPACLNGRIRPLAPESMIRAIALRSGSAIAALIVLLASGCGRPAVEVYDVPKAETSDPRSFARISRQPSSPEDRGWIRWTKPEPWTELAPTAFRKGNYVYEDGSGAKLEITVSSFPGDRRRHFG